MLIILRTQPINNVHYVKQELKGPVQKSLDFSETDLKKKFAIKC